MSYCRWSSDNFNSDVYVYADVTGGYTINLASSRHKKLKTEEESKEFWNKLKSSSIEEIDKLLEQDHKEYMEDIKLPHVGESFNEKTAKDCASRLEYLRGLGYKVPQFAIDALIDEHLKGDRWWLVNKDKKRKRKARYYRGMSKVRPRYRYRVYG